MNMINIALTGLNANQIALNVTAQNVANINTPGYSRQQAINASLGSMNHLNAGEGVQVTGIRRIADQYIIEQTWATASQAANTGRYLSSMTQLENILGGESFSLTTGLNSLNTALNDATVKPDSTPSRQQVINEAEALARRFNNLSDSLNKQHKDLSQQQFAAIQNTNNLLQNIADLNTKISELQVAGGNTSALQDNRDHLVGQLSQMVELDSNIQPDGSLQLSLTSGQVLVLGGDAAQFNNIANPDDPYMSDIGLNFLGQDFAINSDLGGELGAIKQYQTETIKPYQAAVNDMAKNLADEYNRILATGIDLNGDQGKPLFSYDPANPAATLTINDLEPDELAFSADGNPGNGDVLAQLIESKNTSFDIAGFGKVTLSDAFSAMVGETAIKTRQATTDYKAAETLFKQSTALRDNLSGVNKDEEAANVMTFANAYQANMKVISTANDLFNSVLQLF